MREKSFANCGILFPTMGVCFVDRIFNFKSEKV